MNIVHPWLLVLLVVPAVWLILMWRQTSSRLRLVLKALSLAAIILGLSQPQLHLNETKVAVAVLVDTSSSLTDADLSRASSLIDRLQSSRWRHWSRVVPFARATRPAQPLEATKAGWRLQYTAGESGRGTDLEGAVRDAMAMLPSGLVPRIVLISDGNENQGSIARATWQAQQLGIPIDTYALPGRPKPNLRLEGVSLPTVAFTGERFSIDLAVSSPRAAAGDVEIKAEGKVLGTQRIQLQPGVTQVKVQANLPTAGAIDLSGTIRAGDLGQLHFEQAIHLRRPRVLYLSQDPAGTERNLLDTLQAAQFDVQPSADFPSAALSDYQLVILNNWDLESISPARKTALESYVRDGGGLLVIGGERNIYADNKKVEDALDRALPAKLAPPRSPEGTCVVLIVDKSSSMEGRKMELARLAAIGVIENLRPVDSVGVLIFDNSFQWAVQIRKAEDRATIKRLVAGITPDGGTQIAPALNEAYRKALPIGATFKHIVLLTDGISEEGDSIALAKEASQQKVTISTVGLGQDVNRAYLEKVASFSKGKSYFLNDPAGLEQILLKDVKEHTGSTAVEKSLKATVVKKVDLLEGIAMDDAPPLKGYVRFIAKPTAETILKIDEKEPLLARWQFGLGRAAIFSSDAKSRWAAQWVSWNGYERFWDNLCRDLLPRSQASEATAEYDRTSGNLIAEYRLASHVAEPATVPALYVLGPGGFQQSLPVAKTAAGVYRGQLPIGAQQGLFRIRPVAESNLFPEVGLYRQEEEFSEYGANEGLLKQVAAYTGGRFSPDPASVFQTTGRGVETTQHLWPAFLTAGLVLSLAELVTRKWRLSRQA